MTIDKVKLAREVLSKTTMSVDQVLDGLDVTHQEYREHYPETAVTPGLALDVMDAKDVEGLSRTQIQKKWNFTDSQLSHAMYANSLIRKPKDNDKQTLIIRDLHLRKQTQTEIAQEHNVTQPYVNRIAKEQGLQPVGRKVHTMLTQEQKDYILKAYKSGESIAYLAKAYKISRDTIYKMMRLL